MSKASSRPPLLPPCRVCGDRASGFHYGANTCEGCKGFFRRALKNEAGFACTNKNSCVMKPKKRNNCPSCRYSKCIEVGMAKNAIRTGRYTHAVRTKYILECQGKEGTDGTNISNDTSPSCDSTTTNINSPGTSSSACSPSQSSDVSLASGSSLRSGEIGEDDSKFMISSKDLEMSSRGDKEADKDTMSDQEMAAVITSLMNAQEQIHKEDLDIFLDKDKINQRQKNFVAAQEEIHKLPDTVPISCSNSQDTPQQGAALTGGQEAMLQIASYLTEGIKSLVTFAKAVPGFKSFTMEDQVILLKRSVVEFWMLGHFNCMNAELGVFVGEVSMRKEDAGMHWDRNYLDRLYQLADTLQKLNLTKDEVAVLRAVVLTFRDRPGLKNRDMVEAVQWQMINCFKYLCKQKEAAFERRFSFILDKLTIMRELTNTFENSFHSLPVNDAIIEKFPLLTEFFNS